MSGSGSAPAAEPGAGRWAWPKAASSGSSQPEWLRETRRRLEGAPVQSFGRISDDVFDRWEAFGSRAEELIAEARQHLELRLPGNTTGLTQNPEEEEILAHALMTLTFLRRSLEMKSLWFDVPGSTTVILGRPVQVFFVLVSYGG